MTHDFQEEDAVEVVNDYRPFLIGKHGTVFAVVGYRIYVEFGDDVPQDSKRVVLHYDNLKKVEAAQ
jgi:hypothetical protein